MKRLIRGCIIAMILLLALGTALLIQGAVQHARRPLTPSAPDGSVRCVPARGEVWHV